MTIGELLKKYRVSQGKKQAEFTKRGLIVSQSYYSKVEKNINRITADSLIELLNYNNIPLWKFFSQLNSTDELKYQQIKDFNNTMVEAYYENNIEEVKHLKPLLEASNLSIKDKEEEQLIIDAWIEAMKPSSEAPNLKLRNKIKEKIFNIYDFDDTNVALFCDFMQFYELDSNILISKKIIERYINTKNTKMQVVLLAIITNILNFAPNDNKYQSIDYFMENGEKIKNKPELLFYKSAFCFFENIIFYLRTNDIKYYEKCIKIKDFLVGVGITEYGKLLNKFLVKYK